MVRSPLRKLKKSPRSPFGPQSGGGASPYTTPTLTWLTDGTDDTPTLRLDYVESELSVSDVAQFEIDTVNTFNSGDLIQVSNTLDAGELLAGELDEVISALADDAWYARARVGASGGPYSDWSNIVSQTIDTAAPTLSSTSPADNATGVAVGNNLTATFDENIAFGTGNITLRKNDGGWADVEVFDVTTDVGTGAGQVSISGGVLTINPTADLAAGKEHAIRIDATAIDDLAGNSFAGIADDTTWSFTTVSSSVNIVFVDSAVDGVDRSTYTFASQTLGTGKIIVDVGSRAGAVISRPTVTVNGSSASIVSDGVTVAESFDSAGVNYSGKFIVDCAVASGDVVVTFSVTQQRCGIVIQLMTGAASSTASDADNNTGNSSSTNTWARTLTIPTNGAACGYILTTGTSLTHAWTNLTETVDEAVEGATIWHSAGCADFTTGGATSLQVVVTGTVTTPPVVTFATWAP